jgi:hypothetical protein
MKNSPVSVVNEQFQSKEKLVDAVQKLATSELWLDRVSASKGLARVSNQKLLRLHALLSDIKTRFGSRAKLIASILDLEKRAKDAGYKLRLESYPLPRLNDLHQSLSRAQSRAEAKAKPAVKKAPVKKAEPKAKAPVKKAPAKKASGKKASAKKPYKK